MLGGKDFIKILGSFAKKYILLLLVLQVTPLNTFKLAPFSDRGSKRNCSHSLLDPSLNTVLCLCTGCFHFGACNSLTDKNAKLEQTFSMDFLINSTPIV